MKPLTPGAFNVVFYTTIMPSGIHSAFMGPLTATALAAAAAAAALLLMRYYAVLPED